MRILYVTTIGITMRFFESIIASLLQDGHEIHIACNSSENDLPAFYHAKNVTIHDLACVRSPLNRKNLVAIRQIKKIVSEQHFDIVHCHTPIAAMCTRLACRKVRKQGTKVIYTAHGFHFFKGAPWKNWMLFYPIEKICSYFTDVLITINSEDYALAKKKMKARRIEYVRGVGIDTARIKSVTVDKNVKRQEIGVPEDAFLLLSVGELNANKNHESVIKTLGRIGNKKIHYAIAGTGDLKAHLEDVAAENGMRENLHLLGFRCDVYELLKAADAYIHPSFREGLPVSAMEALASGLPIVCSEIRGNVDVVENKKNGIWFSVNDLQSLQTAITELFADRESKTIGATNSQDAEKFDFCEINKEMYRVYFGTDEKV